MVLVVQIIMLNLMQKTHCRSGSVQHEKTVPIEGLEGIERYHFGRLQRLENGKLNQAKCF